MLPPKGFNKRLCTTASSFPQITFFTTSHTISTQQSTIDQQLERHFSCRSLPFTACIGNILLQTVLQTLLLCMLLITSSLLSSDTIYHAKVLPYLYLNNYSQGKTVRAVCRSKMSMDCCYDKWWHWDHYNSISIISKQFPLRIRPYMPFLSSSTLGMFPPRHLRGSLWQKFLRNFH